LHLLLDVAGEVVRRHPARVDVEGCLAAVRVGVDDLLLYGVPGRAVGGPGQPALAGGEDARQLPVWAEGEVDELEIVDGDISRRYVSSKIIPRPTIPTRIRGAG